MKRNKFSITQIDERLVRLVEKTDQRTLALWAIDCAERVMPYFEEDFPDDDRPRNALGLLREWIKTGKFSMKVIRGASLSAHAAAREVGKVTPARSAARAAGQAVATAHVKRHALGASIYALQAIHRAVEPGKVENALKEERERQLQRLMDFRSGKAGL